MVAFQCWDITAPSQERARQGKAKQGKARQAKARQGKARQAGQGKASKARQAKFPRRQRKATVGRSSASPAAGAPNCRSLVLRNMFNTSSSGNKPVSAGAKNSHLHLAGAPERKLTANPTICSRRSVQKPRASSSTSRKKNFLQCLLFLSSSSSATFLQTLPGAWLIPGSALGFWEGQPGFVAQ